MTTKITTNNTTTKDKIKIGIWGTLTIVPTMIILVATLLDFANAQSINNNTTRILTQIEDNSYLWNKVEERREEIKGYHEEYNTIVEYQEELHQSSNELRNQLNKEFSATKQGFPNEKNALVSYAYEKGGKDFMLTLGAENGTWEKNRCSGVNSNGYRDCGICQLNRKWHSNFIDSPEFQDPYKQIDYCLRVYNDGIEKGRITTTFYGYNVRHKTEHLYIIN